MVSTKGEKVLITEDMLRTAILSFPNKTGIGTDGIDKDLLLRMPKEGLQELTVIANIIVNDGVLPCKATDSIIVLLPKPGGARGQ